jgi:hypothetical protein
VSQIILLLGFAFAKVVLAGAIVWFGFRGAERPGGDYWRRDDDPADPPERPRRRVSRTRGGPSRSPANLRRPVRA